MKIITIYDEYRQDEYYPGKPNLNPNEPFSEIKIDVTDQIKSLEEMLANLEKESNLVSSGLRNLRERMNKEDIDETKKVIIENTIIDLINANGFNLDFNSQDSLNLAVKSLENVLQSLDEIDNLNLDTKEIKAVGITDLTEASLWNGSILPTGGPFATLIELRKAKRDGQLIVGKTYSCLEPLCLVDVITSGPGDKIVAPGVDLKIRILANYNNPEGEQPVTQTESFSSLTNKIKDAIPDYTQGIIHYVEELNTFLRVDTTAINLVSVVNLKNQVEGTINSATDAYFMLTDIDESSNIINVNLIAPISELIGNVSNALSDPIIKLLKLLIKLFIKLFMIYIIILSIIGLIKKVQEFFATIGPLITSISEKIGAFLNPSLIPKSIQDLVASIQGLIGFSITGIADQLKSRVLDLAKDVPMYLIEKANNDPIGAISTAQDILAEG